MALSCPRCALPLDEIAATAAVDGGPVPVDTCGACGGLWVDGHELARICPTVSDLPSRRDEVAFIGHAGGKSGSPTNEAWSGIIACPRCGDAGKPYEFLVVDVHIDVCVTCGGVWFDGAEYGEHEGAMDAEAGGDRAGPYRMSAARLARTRRLHCAACAVPIELSSSYFTEAGMVCEGCHSARVTAEVAARGESSVAFMPGKILDAVLSLGAPAPS
jgi:Zn-finger nucleic acid-binding protein